MFIPAIHIDTLAVMYRIISNFYALVGVKTYNIFHNPNTNEVEVSFYLDDDQKYIIAFRIDEENEAQWFICAIRGEKATVSINKNKVLEQGKYDYNISGPLYHKIRSYQY